MTPRQVDLITQLVEACWRHDERRGSLILIDLLGRQVSEKIVTQVKLGKQEHGNG